MITRSSARNLFPPLDNPELTIRRRSRADPTLLNDFEMATEGNGDPPVPDLQTMEELCQPSLNGRDGPISPIAIQEINFGLKNDLIQQSIKVNGVIDDALRLYLFPHSLTHHATAWFDRLPRNSINTFGQMSKMFLGKHFPPSMVTKLRNKITNFRQSPDESLFEAWERYKLSIDRCSNHNMLLVTQIDTFYNGLTLRYRDTINDAVVERETEVTKDTVPPTNNGSTKDVQPSVVQTETHVPNFKLVITPVIEHVVAPVRASKPDQKPSISYMSRLHDQNLRDKANDQKDKFFKIIQDLNFNISFADALILMPKFSPIIKTLLTNKDKLSKLARTLLNEHCSAVLLKKLPEKLGDPGKFLIPCDFPGMDECLALSDIGASINLMPLSVWNKLSLPELSPTCMTLQLADGLFSRPVGVAEDVFVIVGTFHFPANFIVVDFDADPRVPLILRRSFLKTERALIDVFEGELTLLVGKEAISFNLDQTLRYSANSNDTMANQIDVIDMACEECSQEVLGFSDVFASGNPTPYYDPFVSTSSLTLTPFRDNDFLLEEVDAFLALEDDPTSPKELKICEAKNDKSSIDEPPEVELKDLPHHLEYAFLEGDDKLPIIIANYFSVEEKAAIITVLKSHKQAIAWKLSDIKGINLEFYTHKILMEDDFEPAVQQQRRVNPKIYDIIKKEGGFTVVENEENELIPTRLVTGWRVCIDYRKLNEATRKDHFTLPFMDQMLERLAGNKYYCFLDGFSGYFQIPIDLKDQENITFTCSYGTFSYRLMPFGLCNAPGMFQRCMMAIFYDMIEKTMEVFIDDFSVFGNSFGTCLSHLEKMLKRERFRNEMKCLIIPSKFARFSTFGASISWGRSRLELPVSSSVIARYWRVNLVITHWIKELGNTCDGAGEVGEKTCSRATVGGRTGGWTGRGCGRTGEQTGRVGSLTDDQDDQGSNKRIEENGGIDKVPDFSMGDVRSTSMSNGRNGCPYKDFMACNQKDYDRKGGAIVYSRCIKKIESVQDMSGCGTNQKICAMVAATEPTTIQSDVLKARMLTNEAIRNRSLRKNNGKSGNGGELSKDGNVKDENKRSRTGRAFVTVTNPVSKEYTGTAPKWIARWGRMVTLLNARNLTTARGACFKCSSTDHYKAACPRLNRAPRPGGHHQNQSMAIEGGQGRGNNGNQERRGAFMMRVEDARQDPNIMIACRKLVEIVCHEKVVRMPLQSGKILRVLGEKLEEKVRHLMSAKIKEHKLKDIIIVRNFLEVFLDDLLGLQPSQEFKFRIDLNPRAMSVMKSPYCLAPSEMEELSSQLRELQDKGFLRPISSPWGAQLRVHENDIPKTAFRTRYGHFKFTVMPFGLTNAPAKNKTYVWAKEQEEAFQILNDKLCNVPILALLDGLEDFVVYCDALLCADVEGSNMGPFDGECENPDMDEAQFGEGKLIRPEIVQDTTEKISQIKDRLKKGVVRFRKKGKLAPRFLGSFEITKRIGPVAYRLRLPEELNDVHDTFYVASENLRTRVHEVEAE
nr:reverse transcriptase domain-containing protein [Tanacetum cinerariifolium]